MKARLNRLQVVQLFFFLLIAASASAQLKADFSASTITGCPPLVVNFQDLSTGNPTSWKWDLGNGTQSVVANPVGTYFDPGTYTIKLTIRNSANDADSIIRTQYIVVHALPVPAFTASDTAGCFPLTVRFTDNGTAGSGNATTWQWDFGDGNLSSVQNPVHKYTSAGAFTVTLRVTNSNGCSKVVTKTSHVKTFDGVKADFTFATGTSCAPPTPVAFASTSTGTGALSHQWSFGDGNTSTLPAPTHNYNTPGVYSVRLITTSATGCVDTITKSNIINIGTVKANFTHPDTVCANAVVDFQNTSTPATVSSMWNFGDGTSSTAISPKQIFLSAGVYQVKLVNNFGACLDSSIRTIVVLPKPSAAFTADTTRSCKFPFSVRFTSTASAGATYRWTFGDGNTSTQANPVHTYNRNGNFTVTLIVTNPSGCADTLRRSAYISVTPPRVSSINGLNVRGCLPYIINPVANINTSQPITGYLWNFGDGTTSTEANPSHVYTVPGNYNVKLVITTASGCKDSVTINSAVRVGDKPTASFSATPTVACSFTPVVFADSSIGTPIHTWAWDFDDGGTSSLRNPEHQFGDTGYHDIRLVVESFGCADTLILLDYIRVLPPVANFQVNLDCSKPLERTFTDTSIGANTWMWEFGDGNTSTAKSPVHSYAAPGVYKVKLRVTNGSCFHETERDVVVVNEKGSFNISESSTCRNARITFSVDSINTNNISGYTWHFHGLGNGTSWSSTAVVAQSYNAPGNYPAAVVITDIVGCSDTLITSIPIAVYGPQADFYSSPTGTCLGSVVSFLDSTKTDGSHPITKWQWSYGDGVVQDLTTAPFSYTYTNEGVYDVKLVVEDSYGCKDSISKPSLVYISKPVAGFTLSDTALCPSSNVHFTNTSTGGFNVSYAWSFGDGNTSAAANPAHAFPSQASYAVKMVMTDMFGCTDSAFKIIEVFNPTAAFAMSDSFSSCPPLLIDFTNQSMHYSSINWDFGDGGNSQLVNPSRMYTYPGDYTVKLTVTNNGGCIDTITKKITIQGPTGLFTYNPVVVCKEGPIDFIANTQNTVRYIWDFNDGNTLFNTSSTATHHYKQTGTYVPKVILEDAAGCKVPIVGLDTIKVLGVETFISAQPTLLCDSGLVHFTDSTVANDPIAGYTWSFGDGDSSFAATPSHNFSGEGWYTVTLITTTAFGCADTAVYNNHIKVVHSPGIAILGDTAACEPASLTFSGGFVVPDTSAMVWNWSFGNGQTAVGQQPAAQAYATAGSYPVLLTATNSDGCSSTVYTTALIHPTPLVDAGIDTTICRLETYMLTANGASTYLWVTDATLSCTDCASPIASPLQKRVYYVTGTSAFGCVNTDSIVVNVKQPFTVTVGKSDTLCVGQTKQLLASGAELYTWLPAQWLDDASSASPTSRPDSTITYTVVGRDDHSCFTDTGHVTLTVYPIPRIEILNGDAITVNVGSSVKLNTLSSSDVTNWRWTNNRWLNCSTCPEPEATPKQDIVYSVVASNDGKCVARDEILVTLICNNANIYIPNTFSPNGDGMNDVFFPRGTGLYTIKSMRVFNRWGQMVFERNGLSPNNAAQGWDGKLNGINLQTDVYVYIVEAICDNNIVIPIKGNVTLLR